MKYVIIPEEELSSINQKLDYLLMKVGGPSQEVNNWISTKEACDILGVCNTTLWKYRKKGKLRAKRISKKLYFSREDIDNLIMDGNGNFDH